MHAIARRRKVLVAELPGPSGNAASVRAGRRPPGPTFVRSPKGRRFPGLGGGPAPAPGDPGEGGGGPVRRGPRTSGLLGRNRVTACLMP
ncbi:hypothetical protein CP978_07330 [Streptomyces nodosus]|uniref:Uncharacterized protein n=1 Tax=Streptomyces nodosus TaxID=40318 RepID=A0A5P2W048_9ACTN|nr:hypothetical protein CP978_07330 [Streptomyces nodosus]